MSSRVLLGSVWNDKNKPPQYCKWSHSRNFIVKTVKPVRFYWNAVRLHQVNEAESIVFTLSEAPFELSLIFMSQNQQRNECCLQYLFLLVDLGRSPRTHFDFLSPLYTHLLLL